MTSTRPTAAGERYLPGDRLGGRENPVHRAHDLLLQRDVVIKSFPGEDGPARWERDALRRVQLGPGQAMEVLDGAPDGPDGPFVVMPVARGGSLDRAVDPWDPASAALLVARLAVGLGRLHRLGLVHGGVGTDAVLLDPSLGPRWTGQGAEVPAAASPEDDVVALAGIAVAAATGPSAVVADPAPEVVEAVRALVVGPVDAAARLRLCTALTAQTARLGVASRAARVLPVTRRPRRARRAVLAACVGAAVLGGAFGAGMASTGGHADATVVAGSVGGPAVGPTPPAAVLAVPAAGVFSGPAADRVVPGPTGGAPAATAEPADDEMARPAPRSSDRPATRAGSRPAATGEARADDRVDDAVDRGGRGDRADRAEDGDRGEDRGEDRREDRGEDPGEDRQEDRRGDDDGGSEGDDERGGEDRGRDGGDAGGDGAGGRDPDAGGSGPGSLGRALDDAV